MDEAAQLSGSEESPEAAREGEDGRWAASGSCWRVAACSFCGREPGAAELGGGRKI